MAEDFDALFVKDIFQGLKTSFGQDLPLVVENTPFYDYSHPQGQGFLKRSMSSMLDEALKCFSSSRMMGVEKVGHSNKEENSIRAREKLGVCCLNIADIVNQSQDQSFLTFEKLSGYDQGLIVVDAGEKPMEEHQLKAVSSMLEQRKLNDIFVPNHIQLCFLVTKKDIHLMRGVLKKSACVVTNQYTELKSEALHTEQDDGKEGGVDDNRPNKVASAGYGWLNRLLVYRAQKDKEKPSGPNQPLFK